MTDDLASFCFIRRRLNRDMPRKISNGLCILTDLFGPRSPAGAYSVLGILCSQRLALLAHTKYAAGFSCVIRHQRTTYEPTLVAR